MIKRFLYSGIMTVAVFTHSYAQDPTAIPGHSDIVLSSAFTPDPYPTDLFLTGSINVQTQMGRNCYGLIGNEPDFNFYYHASTFPITISVASAIDTTLIIHDPDGEWHCNDDGGEGLNPSIHFSEPDSGLYNIWIGNFGNGEGEPATLLISELHSH